jgi:hypothetical protein
VEYHWGYLYNDGRFRITRKEIHNINKTFSVLETVSGDRITATIHSMEDGRAIYAEAGLTQPDRSDVDPRFMSVMDIADIPASLLNTVAFKPNPDPKICIDKVRIIVGCESANYIIDKGINILLGLAFNPERKRSHSIKIAKNEIYKLCPRLCITKSAYDKFRGKAIKYHNVERLTSPTYIYMIDHLEDYVSPLR